MVDPSLQTSVVVTKIVIVSPKHIIQWYVLRPVNRSWIEIMIYTEMLWIRYQQSSIEHNITGLRFPSDEPKPRRLHVSFKKSVAWWRHRMETFFALLAICAGNSLVTGEFPAQRPVTRSFDVFFDLRLNKHLSKQSWGWWFETPSRPLWRHCNGVVYSCTFVAILTRP